MARLIAFLAALVVLAFGVAWLVDRPGDVSIRWLGSDIEMSVPVLLGLILLAALALAFLLWLYLWIVRIPTRLRGARDVKQMRRGYAALSRGMMAAGAGDMRAARKAADEVATRLPDEPLRLLLNAQLAQMEGDRAGAEAAFVRMAEQPETRLLGLRGLHIEALRRNDESAAFAYACEAHRIAALPWAGEAVVRHHASQSDWAAALETVEANARGKVIDAETADRHRAVLETAMAQEKELTDPDGALRLARQAVKRANDLVPAVVLAGRLLARQGQMRQGARMIETAWAQKPHPELAAAYLDMRPGDSSADRHARAETLARLAPDHAESRLMRASTLLVLRDYGAARAALAPLLENATARVCLMMAEIEEREHGDSIAVRDWLARSARAPRDPAWVADGVTSKFWAPMSPITGKLDAFRWMTPVEQLGFVAAEPVLAPVADSFTPAAKKELEKPAGGLLANTSKPEKDAEDVQIPAPPDDPGPKRPPPLDPARSI